MFEKEAEDKTFEKYPLSDRCDRIDLERNLKYEEGFKDGAEFGYNKANEWHKVSDKLPEMDTFVYLLFRGDSYPTIARRHLFKEWGRLKWCWDCKWGSGYTVEADCDRVIAWKEIVLPKEVKENDIDSQK